MPASVGQEALWLIDQLNGGSAQYSMVFAFRVHGELNVSALGWGLNQVIARHGALRTTFTEVDGRPRQKIADELVLHLDVEVVSGGDEAVRRRLDQEAGRGFDLHAGPLFRAGLLKTADRDHVLLMAAHHAIFDGRSLDLLMSELREFYTAAVEGGTAAVEPVVAQYADFAGAESDWLESAESKAQLEFWRRTLDGAEPFRLPGSRPRPAIAPDAGETVEFEVAAEDVGDLSGLLAAERVTPFMFMVAVHHVTLARMSGQRDIVVGSPMSNRREVALLRTIGYFLNIVALRIDSAGDRTFRDLLRRVRNVSLDAYENKDYPFEKLVAHLGPRRDRRATALFETVFSFDNASVDVDVWPGLEIEPVDTEEATAKSDMAFSILSTERGFRGSIACRAALFDRATIESLATEFVTTLRRVTRDPDAELPDLLADLPTNGPASSGA
ncbi:condensation domain-containing protein [Streptomyces huasconensis]|uniref:Condensation domain-containing protein n=1 Tax=Streptomyces huasconensis TaxID=1854574 RepID=A0ABV3LTH2_9ACTN